MLYLLIFLTIVFGILFLSVISIGNNVEGTSNPCNRYQCKQPTVKDPNLKIELIFQGNFKFESWDMSPVSSMTFLGPDDILILNKNNGTIYRIVNGTILKDRLLDVNVANARERGLLGITTSKDKSNAKYIFLYYTESGKNDGSDVCPKTNYCLPGTEPVGNRLYRYELKDNKLINSKLLLDLPVIPGPTHDGGVVKIGPDNNVYVTIGDVHGDTYKSSSTKAQNFRNGTDPDGRSGILRITQDGKAVGHGILGSEDPLNKYYAYGIRNSFGIDFDPVTGNLWDTENGPEYGDEVNLVKPGFNSGWMVVQGIWRPVDSELTDYTAGDEILNPDHNLVDFNGKGKYRMPEFTWKSTVGPTALKFFDSDGLGKEYKNDLFVGCVNLGTIFHFDLIKDRTGLKLDGPLKDKIADNNEELQDIIFAQGLGSITDIEVGPDGYLYVLSKYMNKPTIFKISPS